MFVVLASSVLLALGVSWYHHGDSQNRFQMQVGSLGGSLKYDYEESEWYKNYDSTNVWHRLKTDLMFSTITKCAICRKDVVDADVEFLLHSVPLVEINLTGTLISEEFVSRLRKRFPKCRVIGPS